MSRIATILSRRSFSLDRRSRRMDLCSMLKISNREYCSSVTSASSAVVSKWPVYSKVTKCSCTDQP